MQGSPELLEVKMGADGYSDGSDDNNRDIDNDNSVEVSVIIYLNIKFLLITTWRRRQTGKETIRIDDD